MPSSIRLKLNILTLVLGIHFLFVNTVFADGQELVLFSRSLPNGELEGDAALLKKSERSVGILATPNNLSKKVLLDSGPSSNRIDIVYLADGYLASENTKFSSQVDTISTNTFLQMPLKEYKNYFNIHQIFAPSNESGIDNDGQPGIPKDTILDGRFYCQDVKENICVDVAKAWEMAAQARDFDQIAVLINSSSDGGSAYPFSDISVVTAGYTQASNNLLHQIGHSFANLADEYDNGSWPTYTGFEPAEPNVSAQSTESMLLQKIKWNKWINVDSGPNFGGIINTYEGAMGHKYSIYRPTENSKMRNLNAPFNNPSIESFIKEIYKKVRPIDSATSESTPLTGSSTITVTPLQPIGRNLSVQWSVDGVPVQGANQYSFRANDYPYSDGVHVVSVDVVDDTPLLKDEAFRTEYMKEKRSWSVSISQKAPIITRHPASVSVIIGSYASLSVVAVGEDLKYQWFKNGIKIDGATLTSYQTPPAKREVANYYVEISNVQGTVRSKTASVNILNRAPTYSGSSAITLSRLEEGSISFTLNDADSDTISKSYTLESSSQPGASITLDDDKLTIKTGASFLGQFVIKLALTDSYTTAYFPITVTVKNNLPTLEPISDISRIWTTDKASIPLNASDIDSMDSLALTANLTTGTNAPVVLSISNKVLTIDPQAGYAGSFNVQVKAHDGITFSSRIFKVTWANDSPVVDQIPAIRSHYRAGGISRSIVANDPNGDPLKLSAAILPSDTPVSISLSGSTLNIAPAPSYKGVSTIKVSAFDGGLTSVMNTSLEVYNSAPVIDPISAVNVNQNKKTISIPVKISDPDAEDKDFLHSSARLLNGQASGVSVKLEGENLIVESTNNFNIPLTVEISATDGDLTTKRNVQLSVQNSVPVLNTIEEQLIHPIKEDIRTISLQATDSDNDTLTFTAEVIKPNAKAPILIVSGNQLSIDPVNNYLGSFAVRVVVSDGLSETTQTFKVTTYNTDPELNAICDRSAPYSKFPLEIPLTANDPDGEELTFEGSIERASLPFLLKTQYNFDGNRFRPENSLGLNERYISGDKNETGNLYWFYILPNGNLYEFNKTHEESKFLLKLPSGYYENPVLLFNGDAPSSNISAFSLSFNNNNLKVALSKEVHGSALVRVKAKDFFSFTEKTFILTVTESTISLQDIPDLDIHWKEGIKTGSLIALDPATGSTPSGLNYNITEYDGTLARELDEQYNFEYGRPDIWETNTIRDETTFPKDNYTNRNEKYIRAFKISYSNNGTPTYSGFDVFAILPNGDLYKCTTMGIVDRFYSLNAAVPIAELDPIYYRDTSLLINASSGSNFPLSINLSGDSYSIGHDIDFLGKIILKATASKGIASDSKLFMVHVYDTAPVVNLDMPLTCNEVDCRYQVSWKSGAFRIPFSITDPDPLDSILEKSFEINPKTNSSLEVYQYSLRWAHKNGEFDRDGWREYHFQGIYNQADSDFAITPDGKIYKWNGNPTNSVVLTQVSNEYYEVPAKLDSSKNIVPPYMGHQPSLTIEGSELVVTPKANFAVSSGILAWADDGKMKGFGKLPLLMYNSPPVLADIANKTSHWRDNLISESLSISDPDGDTIERIIPSFTPSQIIPAINSSVNGYTLNLNAKFGFLGSFLTNVTVLGEGQSYTYKSFSTTIYNTPPELSEIGTKEMAWTKNTLEIPVSMSDADIQDSDKLLLLAYVGTPSDFADSLIARHKFTKTGAAATNSLGLSEIHFKGKNNGVSTEFLLLPSEGIYAIVDSKLELIGFLPAGTYQNPNRLLSIINPNYSSPHSLNITGNNKLILNKSSSTGTNPIKVTAWATDSINAKSETFTVNIIDRAPVLPDLSPSYQRHWNPGLLELSNFPLSDEDQEAISYTITSSPAGLQHSVNSSGVLNIKATNPKQLGTYTVNIQSTSGSKSTNKTLNLTFTNQNPSILPLAGIYQLGYKESFSVPFVASDLDSDPLSFSTSFTGAHSENFLVAVAGSQLKVSPKVPTAGEYYLSIKASDGPSETQTQTKIKFINRQPTLHALSKMDIPWTTKVGTQNLTYSDLDNDTLEVSTVVSDPNIANAVANGNTLTITLKNYAPTFTVKVIVSDGVNSAESEFLVEVKNAKPILSGLPASRQLHWNTDQVTQSFSVSDKDGDTINVVSSIKDNSVPATVSNTNSLATINITQKKMGELTLLVKAFDEVTNGEGSTKFTFTNTKPKIKEIGNQIFSSFTAKTVSIEASDPDNDSLTLTSRKMSHEEVAFDLDSMFDFTKGDANFEFNKLGNNEKYLRGTDPVRKTPLNFVIFPNGRFYIWTGILTTSTFIGTIPMEFHADPNKLINAPTASPSNINFLTELNGSTMKLAPLSILEDNFWIKAAASDTQETAVMYFNVNSFEELEPDAPAGDSQCLTTLKNYDGELSLVGRTLSVIEGRIGDALVKGSQTNELSIGINTNGPFSNGQISDYQWTSSKKESFSITVDPTNKIANFTLGGKTLVYSMSEAYPLSDLLIRVRRGNIQSSMRVESLKLNGKILNGLAYVDGNTNNSRSLQIRAVNELKNKFTLEGVATMTFSTDVKDAELAFQVSLVNADNAPQQCTISEPVDQDPEDLDPNARKVKICHSPPGNPNNFHTISISKNALVSHLAHGDVIGECPGAPNDPGSFDPGTEDPEYPSEPGYVSCDMKQLFASPNYTLWNSFLNMTNILELTNSTANAIPVKISFYSILGELAHQRTISVPATNQFDVILNEFPGFVKDSYGVVKLEFAGNLDGRMSFYRPTAGLSSFDYAYSIPLSDASFGTTAISFNTFQPSQKPSEVNNLVANWLSIVNLDPSAQKYNVFSYDMTGKLVLRREIEVPSFGRADVDGGHDLAGPNVVGYHKIVPFNVTAEYIAQITRFGGDAPAGFASSSYKFAFPLLSKLGASDPIFVPVSNKFGESNWVEVVNILDKEVQATINYYSTDGKLLESADALIPANAQLHFNATAELPTGATGYASIVPGTPYSITAQSIGYLRETSSGSVTSVYASQARRAVPCVQSGAYNLYLDMQNWLLVANTTNDTLKATVKITGPSLSSNKVITLAPRASVYLPIHANTELGTKPDTYGLIAVYPEDSAVRLFSEVMRLRYKSDGSPDFSMPVPVR